MKRIFWLSMISTELALLLLPVPWPGYSGMFNPLTGLYWCREAQDCLHERGHVLDRSLGWPSQSREFSQALEIYYPVGVYNTPQPAFSNSAMESYAGIYAMTGGDVDRLPEALRKFYLANWKER